MKLRLCRLKVWTKLTLLLILLPSLSPAQSELPPVTPEGFGVPGIELEKPKEPLQMPNAASIKPESLVGFQKILELTGPPDKPMVMPTDVAIGAKGQIYVVDSGNNRILVFAQDGAYLFAFASPGEGDGQLIAPVGITTAGDGSVLVADRGNKRVQVFDADGKFLKSIPTLMGKQRVPPVDVALDDSTAYLYVTVSAPLHRILAYNNKGRVDSIWGKPGSNLGEFRYPAAIAIGPNKYVYIVDVFNSRVQALDFSGKVQVTVGSWGVTPGHLFRPKGIAVREDGLSLVSDSYLGVVQLFDTDTRFLAVLGNDGNIAYFDTPTGLAADSKGRVFVAEMLAHRVSVLQLEY